VCGREGGRTRRSPPYPPYCHYQNNYRRSSGCRPPAAGRPKGSRRPETGQLRHEPVGLTAGRGLMAGMNHEEHGRASIK